VEILRSPWRATYVSRVGDDAECVLCRALREREAKDSLVVHVAEHCFVVMNLYPYNSGHLMLSPKRHVAKLAEASEAELGELMRLAKRSEGILQEAYRPDGLNVGMNLGRVAGAGVEGHLHLHVVPRWSGDTNFMTTLAQTRVIPEDPVAACARLKPYFGR
jgi:ATP adenylyltransferase